MRAEPIEALRNQLLVTGGPAPDKAALSISLSKAALSPVRRRAAHAHLEDLPRARIQMHPGCRHVSPGKHRDMFSDMAKQWISLAANIERSEDLLDTPTANDVNGPHRFGSRIEKRKDTTTEAGDAPF